MKLSTAIQEALVALLLLSNDYAAEVSLLVQPRDFDPYYSEFADAASDYLKRYGKPAGEHALDLLDNLCDRLPKNADFYRRIYESIQENSDGLNPEYVVSQARSFVRYQQVKRGLSEAIDALDRGNEAGVAEAERVLSKAIGGSREAVDPGTFMADTSRSLDFLDMLEQGSFMTGIKEFDDVNLGPARGRLHLFAGPLKTGKSWWLVNLAKHALMEGRRVVYITLELSEAEVSQRIVQSILGVPKRREPVNVARFTRDELGRFTDFDVSRLDPKMSLSDPNARKLLVRKLAPLKRRPPLVVKQFPTGDLTGDELEAYLDMLEARFSLTADLVLVDHLTLMTTDPKNYRISIGGIAKRLRAIAIRRNLAMASAAQTNRSAKEARLVTAEHTGEDYSLPQHADVFITYNQTDAERALGLARLFVGAGRSERDRFTVLISQAYGLGQFALDSVGYVSDYQDVLKRRQSED